MKRIEFNLKNTVAYVNSSSLNTMRLWMSTPPFIKVDWAQLNTQEKYKVLVDALNGSKVGLPMPQNPKEFSGVVLRNFGFISWRQYCDNGKHCSIKLDIEKSQYVFTPLIYLNENNSLYGIKEGEEIVSLTASEEEIIFVLERVLHNIPRLTEEYYQRESESNDLD